MKNGFRQCKILLDTSNYDKGGFDDGRERVFMYERSCTNVRNQ